MNDLNQVIETVIERGWKAAAQLALKGVIA
jgi:hypothetical protein